MRCTAGLGALGLFRMPPSMASVKAIVDSCKSGEGVGVGDGVWEGWRVGGSQRCARSATAARLLKQRFVKQAVVEVAPFHLWPRVGAGGAGRRGWDGCSSPGWLLSPGNSRTALTFRACCCGVPCLRATAFLFAVLELLNRLRNPVCVLVWAATRIAGTVVDLNTCDDPHVIAGLLLHLLREREASPVDFNRVSVIECT
jgi:hypothetical protein